MTVVLLQLSTTDCLNFAGDPTLSPTFTNGQRVQLFADGVGTDGVVQL